ncbi:MAG: MFS transporter [Ruminococcaceae bacterium]|nr:MFS transporter [Oscillospiraceae bacterium]
MNRLDEKKGMPKASRALERRNVYRSFNYVGTKETVAYLFNDFSNTFNIDAYKDRFIWDVVKIDFGVSAIANIFTGAWDVINDTIIATIVDNTRTRLGKFRPYLITFQVPLVLLGIIYWFLPHFFPNTSATFIPKLIFYFAFSVISETAGTFTSVAKSGYMSTITPNPNERIRLITLAELLTGYMGEDLPQILMGVFYDLINTGKINVPLKSLFAGMGSTTAVVSCVFTLWFFIVSRERVPQSIERPSVKEGLRAIFTNYPVLLMCLSEFLTGFKIKNDERNYWIDVHGGNSMINTLTTLVGFISGPVGSVSYAFVSPIRKRFSSRAIWVGSDIYDDMCVLGFFLIGLYKKNYLKLTPMLIAFGFRELLVKMMFGVNKVINVDLWNEAMDYCEWKHGYRMEATTGVARDLVLKLQKVFMGTIRLLIMKKIGYVQGLKIGTQDERTKFWLFALSTVVPLVTSALGIIPKMLWPIDKKMRERMYYELAESRAKKVSDYNELADSESPPAGQET